MSCIRHIAAVAAVAAVSLLASTTCCAQQPTEQPPARSPAEREIARLIGLLDADTFDARERATRELAAIGFPALPALERVRQAGGAEVRARAKALIDSLTSALRRREFTDFASQSDERLDVEHGMWLIARILDPQVKKAELTKQLDEIAARVRQRLGEGAIPAKADPQKVVAALRHVLFVDHGFTGNAQDYNNPDNSSLARVLATRKGLPILLSQVTVAVARRLGVPVVGIPLSGTYVVKYDGHEAPAGFAKDDIFIHPFEQGRLLSREDLEKAFPGQNAAETEPGTSRETLTRMLRNLSSALAGRNETEKQQQVEELYGLLQAYEIDPGKFP